MGIRSCLDQRPDDVRVPPRNGPHQSRMSLPRLIRVHVRPVTQERSDRLHVARAGACDERRLPGPLGRIRIGARVQEGLHHGGAPVDAGQRERRHAIGIGQVRVGACADQKIGRLSIVPVGRPGQCRRSIRFRRIDIGALFYESTHHCRSAAVLDRVHQPEIVGRGGTAGGREHARQPQAGANAGSSIHREHPHAAERARPQTTPTRTAG